MGRIPIKPSDNSIFEPAGDPTPHSLPHPSFPRGPRPVQQPAPAMPPQSGRPNRDFADELLSAAREELARQPYAEPGREARAQGLRRQIEATQQRGRDNPKLENKERLRELGREHHRLTGTSGKAT